MDQNAAKIGQQFWSGLKSFGSQVESKLLQGKQLVEERLGNAQSTDLPQEYRDLEVKVDKIRTFHEGMLKITKSFVKHTDFDVPIQDSIGDLTTQIGHTLGQLGSKAVDAMSGAPSLPSQPVTTDKEKPVTLSHQLAKTAAEAANNLGLEEPTGAALAKFSHVENKIGDLKLTMDKAIEERFYKPFDTTLKTLIANAMTARRQVQANRIAYDSCKSRFKTAKPEKVEMLKQEMEKAEDAFVASVEDAMGKMQLVVASPEPLRNLADFVAAQLAYYKESYEILAELSPEMDELQVTNEALLRGDRDE